MRSTKARMRLESLEGRALLATSAGFVDTTPPVVNDQVGKVDVAIQSSSSGADFSMPQTVTVTTTGITAVPGVDYTPVRQTLTLTPNSSSTVSIPILPGPASLGTRTLELSISPTPGAPPEASQWIVITHGADIQGPAVVGSQALTSGGKIVAFSVQFSKPMAIGPVTDLSNYAVAAPASARELVSSVFEGPTAFSKGIPLKSAIYDAATNTVYLVPVKPAAPAGFRKIPAFVVEQPGAFAANLKALKARSGNPPVFDPGFSKLPDTSGNPITVANPGDNSLSYAGSFTATPMVTKATPSVLSLLFGTPTHATAKASPKLPHKSK